MNPEEKIKKLIDKSKISTDIKTEKKILGNALEHLDKLKQQKSPLIRQYIWRIIMKNRIIKLTAAAIIVIAVISGLNMFDGSSKSGKVFANVIQQIRNARTATFISETHIGGQVIQIKNYRKEPGLTRVEIPGDLILIKDLRQKKSLTIYNASKQYTIKILSDMQSDDPLAPNDFFEQMKTLPVRANEVLGKQNIDGRIAQGFRVYENGIDTKVWIDVQTGDLVLIEGRLPNAPNTYIISKDFLFDIELNDAMFSLVPPNGYTNREDPEIDKSENNYKDLLNLLEWWVKNTEGNMFPPSLELSEFMETGSKMKQEGKVSAIEGTEQEKTQQFAKITRGLTFVMMMEPERDWHYEGRGVKFGDANTPVCWWKPEGSETYLVIYGDLSTKNVEPEDLPLGK